MGSRHLPLLLSLLFLSSAGNLTAYSPDCSSLLLLNSSFTSSLLPSWDPSTDCCTWGGVTCDPLTGRITGLDLSNRSIVSSAVGPALFSLTSLRTLNLAYNLFDEIPIPKSFQELRNLTHLNLSNSGFTGQIPIEIAGLANLVSLDLSTFYLNEVPTLSLSLESPNLAALVRNLTSLRELYLDGVNVSDTEWCQALASSAPGLTSLSLTACSITGPIDSSLSRITNLSMIRLDQNQLNCTVPDFFANFTSLRVLRLSFCGLRGKFPKDVFALESLATVDLSSNPMLSGTFPDFSEGSRIESLVVRETNFSGQLPDSIGKMNLLSKLDLSSCQFSGRIPASIANLTELVALDLSANRFSGTIPPVMPQGISDLNFARNLLNGSIPSSFGKLGNLTNLDLSNNSLSGPVPASLFALPLLLQLQLNHNQLSGAIGSFNASDRLGTVDLSNNKLSGEIPMSVFKLSGIKILTLASNNFSGIVELDWFRDLRNLSILDLSSNSLSVRGGDDGNPSLPFPVISTLKLVSCNLTEVPSFLKHQDHVINLDLSNNRINGSIPSWIWTRTSLIYLNLSMNLFTFVEGPLPNFSTSSSINIDLHSNLLGGPIPLPPTYPIILDYSDNLFSSIPSNISLYLTFTLFFSLSKNRLTGGIPQSICSATYLQVLDFSDNNLTGQIPPCIFQAGNVLRVLNLRNNRLWSTIPQNISEGCVLKTINLNGNLLKGEVPWSLANCNTLELLDLGNNRIGGSFPSWLGSIPSLRVLVLRSNRLRGPIVPTPKYNAANYTFPLLQILDLSSNQLNGNLPPECFKILKGMASSSERNWSTVEFKYMLLSASYYQDTVTVRIKGLDLALVKILTVFTSIDLSNNNFSGEIPEEIGSLGSLLLLNLSRNALTGHIPWSIGNLTQLESLDLSVNMLTGEIPRVLTFLYFLSSLNLSSNKLVGRIPTGNQLLTFSSSSYEDNPGLCGSPLPNQCSSPSAGTPYMKSATEVNWQSIFVGVGYGGGLAAVFGFLMVSDTGKKRYAREVDRLLWAVVPSSIWRMCEYYFGDRRVRDEAGEAGEAMEAERWPSRKFCVFCTKLMFYEDRLVLLHNEECQCSLK